MSQLIFPALPGLAWPVARNVIAPPVKIKTTPSRRTFRARDSSTPLYDYALPFEFLRIRAAYAEWQTLMGFFNKVGGPFDDFLFDDLDDNTCTAELMATGDGTSTVFQLARSLGGFLEPLYGVNGTPTFTVAGSGVTPSSVGNTGAVTFASPPANGALIRWSGKFYWRCNFVSEKLEFTKNFSTFYESKKVEFRTMKPL